MPTLHYEAAESFSALVPKKQHALVCISFFLLLSIFIRSFMGFMVTFPRKVGFLLGVVFTLSVMCGKAFGGVLADKFGFEKVGISSLAIASVLLGWCSAYPIAGLVGIFLFNMTMPITLVALVNSFKGRPGFAFGLTTLALIIGAMPYYA
ncbi:MAG: hypothetical protein LBP53_01960 [Candidatus Peribacteria bacterium]|nr:hypothetical protein [Candidatus Peribacteria bacterium]